MAQYPTDHPAGQPREQGSGQPMHMPSYAPLPPAPGGRPPVSKNRVLGIVVAVAVLLAIGGGLYVLLNSKKAAPTTTTTQHSSPNDASSQSDVTSSDSGPHTYKSAKLNIEFTYPAGWSMKENGDKSVITLTSPQTSYTKKDGTSASGVFTLRLRNGLVPDAAKQVIQNAVAMKDSEIIAYDKPTEQQRQYTNISEGGNGPNTSFFVVSGGVAFKAGEAFGSNIDLEGAVYLFAGGYGADSSDAWAFDAVPKAAFEGPMYQQAVGIIKSMKIY